MNRSYFAANTSLLFRASPGDCYLDKSSQLSEKVPLGLKMENRDVYQGNLALSDCCLWEKPAANEECASARVLPGQYFDAETGFHYNHWRYYSPEDGGRYITSDPIGLVGGLNTYLYANANPLRYIDPDGLRALPTPWGPIPVPIPGPIVPDTTPNNNSSTDGSRSRERSADRQRRDHAWHKDNDAIPDSAVDDVDVPIPDAKESKKDKCIEECYYHLEMSWLSSDIRTNNFNRCVNACMEREDCE